MTFACGGNAGGGSKEDIEGCGGGEFVAAGNFYGSVEGGEKGCCGGCVGC